MSNLRHFLKKHSIDAYTHIRTSTHPMNTRAHPTPINISERLDRIDLEIHKVGHQDRFTIDEDVAYH
jgi:hypothetical protein